MDDILNKAKQKALELLGQTKSPGMGNVKLSDYESGLDKINTPYNGPKYEAPEDYQTAEQLRDAKRDLLLKGVDDKVADSFYFPGNYPSQDEIIRHQRALGAGMTAGTIGNVGSKFGRVLQKISPIEKIEQQIQNLKQNLTPENIEKIKELSKQIYGKVITK